MYQKAPITPFSLLPLLLVLLLGVSFHAEAWRGDVSAGGNPYAVKKEQRRPLVVTEYGEISAAEVTCGTKGPHHLQFITLEPNSLFLPVLLHADMVFYVHTGSGRLSWVGHGKEMRRTDLVRGDVYRLQPGSLFFLQSNLDTERQKLRIYAIFSSADEDVYEQSIGAYSRVRDLILGFDKKLLQSAFMVSEEVIEEITGAMEQPAIVHAMPAAGRKKSILEELETRLLKSLVRESDTDISFYDINGKHKKIKKYNILKADPDFENCNGWSLTVDRKRLGILRGSHVGIFMVNLTKGSMMAPHWNPMANEIAIVLHGRGIVRVVCASTANASDCKNMTFRVVEGDVFAVPRFHPMAQMSFNNDSFVFMGFSTSTRRNYPQFLTGKRSVLHTMDRGILAVAFNVTNTTISQLLGAQDDALILDCTSCAEEEERIMEEEEEARKREEQERKREEEEARKREEEEEARKREEEARKREEEEEARKREEEERKREEEEEAREREEEEARKREEEERKREEEKEAREREEEERKREEEEAREEEEREREREQEEEKQRRREEKKRQEEEERLRREAAQREQEEARRQEEERQRRQKRAEEEARRERERQEEEERRQQEEEREREEGGEGQPERETKENGRGSYTISRTMRKV